MAPDVCPLHVCCAAVAGTDTGHLLEGTEHQVVLLLAVVEGDTTLIWAALPRTRGLVADGPPDAAFAVRAVH